MFRISCTFLFFILSTNLTLAQSTSLAEFTVHAGAYDRLNTPIIVYADELQLAINSADSLRLVEHQEDSTLMPVQWIAGERPGLSWVLSGETPAGSTRRFSLRRTSESVSETPTVRAQDQGGSVALSLDQTEVLHYQYTPADVPPGVDTIYRRGGFIHPLRSPAGAVLTRIQPPDHYHHYGIWNPWTHTEYEGREIDFWNLAKGQGTVESRGTTSVTSGPVSGGLRAWHEHITTDSADRSTARKLLNEVWNLRLWNSDPEQKSYLLDFVSVQSNATDQPLILKEYRYQ